MQRIQRAVGAVVGSAVGDALGGPFEFGPRGAFSARFPIPGAGGEMCGGGGWDPGEATDDTQMTVLVAESLLERGGLDLPDIFARFQRWAAAEPKDIGLQTEDVLTNGMPWDLAAAIHFQVWPCLGSVVWALRTTAGFEDAIRAAIDLGGDTDTVAAVTGGLAGAYYGLDAIPAHWTQPLHVPLPGFDGRVLRLADLLHLAHRLGG
ncbi:ADP-ribosylglycohydrolase family protein [Streptomyces sp. NPDC000987]|uniref:ADP-ribosylglycohydrolase family protein n=1 Tax=Streptomyces sp. NPDC000987 TaxID=3154374 RepID=UPI00332B671D